MAVLYPIGHSRQYRTGRPFTLVTDYAPHTSMVVIKKLSAKLHRWALRRTEYNTVTCTCAQEFSTICRMHYLDCRNIKFPRLILATRSPTIPPLRIRSSTRVLGDRLSTFFSGRSGARRC